MSNNILTDAIGSGVTFPIVITRNDSGTKTWATVSGDVALIENNIRSLLEYHLGLKLRCENFGTRLYECFEEQNNQLLVYLVKRFLADGINGWEPRVILLQKDISVTINGPEINIHLRPQVILTQSILDIDFSYNQKINT